jgi:hypothetical protein
MKKLFLVTLAVALGYWAYRVWRDSERTASLWHEVTDAVD